MSQILKDKSIESKRAGEICLDKEKYSSSISRFYYSVLQYMMYILESNGISSKAPQGQDSHTHIMSQMWKLCIRTRIINAFDLKSDFQSIKKMRIESDYTNKRISKKDAEAIKKFIIKMHEYLIKF